MDDTPFIAPYVPCHPHVAEAALKFAGVGGGDVLVDLGCGDGRILSLSLSSATPPARCIGIELDPYLASHIRANHSSDISSGALTVLEENMFTISLIDLNATVLVLYLLPAGLDKLKPILNTWLRHAGTGNLEKRIVTIVYEIPGWDPVDTMFVDTPSLESSSLSSGAMGGASAGGQWLHRYDARSIPTARTVLFCRGKSDTAGGGEGDAREDRYEAVFTAAGFRCLFVPVLEHAPRNGDKLMDIIQHPEHYSGLIATSRRALETLKIALEECQGDGTSVATSAWSQKPIYVVGKSTGSLARDLGFSPRGEDSGTADGLADLIVNEPKTDKPLLFLVGDKRRDVLPHRLTQAGVSYDELLVYETQPSSTFPTDLETQLRNLPDGSVDWVVFFSPSGVDVALPSLQGTSWWSWTRIAAIGPTTGRYLGGAGVKVDAEAVKPSPEALLDAMLGK
ncbi:hypothetical protein HK104_003476 [Borealophlyctis nickersoniae]|nr:hypothetical protein HK104_003476 [Borealophlyctis nickersoniae]